MSYAAGREADPYVIPLSLEGDEALSFDMTARQGWAAYFSEMVEKTRAIVLIRIGPEDGPSASPAIVDGEPRLVFSVDHASAAALEVRELRVAVGPKTAGFASSLMRDIPFTRIEAAVNHPDHRRHLIRHVLPANAVRAGDTPGGMKYLRRPAVNSLAPRSLVVVDPGGYRKPDSFYAQVSDLYLWQAAVSSRPAQDLANANDTPVATVHRWIREAKARGLLLLPSHRAGTDVPERRELSDLPTDRRVATEEISVPARRSSAVDELTADDLLLLEATSDELLVLRHWDDTLEEVFRSAANERHLYATTSEWIYKTFERISLFGRIPELKTEAERVEFVRGMAQGWNDAMLDHAEMIAGLTREQAGDVLAWRNRELQNRRRRLSGGSVERAVETVAVYNRRGGRGYPVPPKPKASSKPPTRGYGYGDTGYDAPTGGYGYGRPVEDLGYDYSDTGYGPSTYTGDTYGEPDDVPPPYGEPTGPRNRSSADGK